MIAYYQIVSNSGFPFPSNGALRCGYHSLTKWPTSLTVVMFVSFPKEIHLTRYPCDSQIENTTFCESFQCPHQIVTMLSSLVGLLWN